MAAISRRGQGGHIYNNTRARVLLRRMCVKPAALTTHSPPKVFAYPPAQRHALPEHFRSPTQPRRTPAGCAMHARRPHNPFPAEARRPPRTATRPSRALSHPHAATTHTRRLRDAFLAEGLRPSPSVPLRAQKNGTAQWMCDAECLGRPSLRSVIWVGEPRAVRRRCGALRVGVGLRPQPWALRSRRCGRVLRA